MSNRNMNRAKAAKNDEFYTQLGDIENEMRHYKPQFKNKIIYMNTDHPDYSNFWLFFKLQFNHLKLKKITSTFYNEDGESFKTEYDGKDEIRTPLKGDGDFRSEECVAILKESDVIVTNPPFSLFREFIDLLINHEKSFVILGNNNAIAYKEIFPLIKSNKMWLGMQDNVTMEFEVPQSYTINSGGRVDSKGSKFLKVSAITWFTNLDYPKRHDDLILWASYEGSEHEYPKYDNYDAINVDRVSHIPYDYEGVIGVPISFIGKWNPDQFEILGLGITDLGRSVGVGRGKDDEYHKEMKRKSKSYRRGTLCYYNSSDELVVPYSRVLIKNKKPRKTLIPED